MITATEAKALVSESESEVDRYIVLADKLITETAKSGKSVAQLYNGFPWDSFEVYRPISPSTIQQLIVKKLQAFGFYAAVEKSGNTYVPKGLCDDDGDGPLHVNHCIVVKW